MYKVIMIRECEECHRDIFEEVSRCPHCRHFCVPMAFSRIFLKIGIMALIVGLLLLLAAVIILLAMQDHHYLGGNAHVRELAGTIIIFTWGPGVILSTIGQVINRAYYKYYVVQQ